MGKYRGLDTEEGWIRRRFAELERMIVEQAAARRLVIATNYVQVDVDSFDLGLPWTSYGPWDIAVPEGFTHVILNLFASAGTTFAGTNNGIIGVQPVANGVPGSAISTGKNGGGAISVNSTFATKLPVTGDTFPISLKAYADGGARTPNTGNIHVSGAALFVRA